MSGDCSDKFALTGRLVINWMPPLWLVVIHLLTSRYESTLYMPRVMAATFAQ